MHGARKLKTFRYSVTECNKGGVAIVFQFKVLHSMKTECREGIEKRINEVQPTILRDDDVQHFREVDASRIQWKLSAPQ